MKADVYFALCKMLQVRLPNPNPIPIPNPEQANTTCCYTLTTPTMPTSLYNNTVSSALAIVSPLTGIRVLVGSSFLTSATSAAACNVSGFSQVGEE